MDELDYVLKECDTLKKFVFAFEIFSLTAAFVATLFDEIAYATLFAVYAVYLSTRRKEVS